MINKIIITGATGLIGRKLCSKLLEQENEITIFTRNPEAAKKVIRGAKQYVLKDVSICEGLIMKCLILFS